MRTQHAKVVLRGEDADPVIFNINGLRSLEEFRPLESVEVSKLAVEIDSHCFGGWPIHKHSRFIVDVGRHCKVNVAVETRNVLRIISGRGPALDKDRLDTMSTKDSESGYDSGFHFLS